jgi:TonB-linked SusC/RagA family outer membrane protein
LTAVPGNSGLLQQDVVRGTIRDAQTGEALIGVTVMVKGTTLGTLTDLNGGFSLRIPDRQATLVTSFIGYSTQEIAVTQGSSINVSMQLEVTQIQEVVVVGYGVQKKESVVGAITQVDNAALVQSGTQNITNAIAGKLSGVLTIQQSGEPGANEAEIIVRGLSSWNSSAPLVLVDGVERDFSNIDPNEINTISVLKDASATAVFGAKGANGVIIVTTKRGSLGKPKVDYSFTFGRLKASRIPSHISSYTTMYMKNVANLNDQQYDLLLEDKTLNEYLNPSSPLKALQYPDVNWFEACVVPFTPVINGNMNISGGTDFIKYFASFGYQHEGNLFEGLENGYQDSRFKNDRFNYRTNVDFSLTRTTMLSLNLGGDINVKNQPSAAGDVWGTIYESGPAIFPAYFPEWVLEEVPDLDYPNAKGWRRSAAYNERWGNPYTNFIDGSFRNYTGSEVFTDLILDQKLDFITKGLSIRGKASLSTYYNMLTMSCDYRYPEYYLYYDRIGVDNNNDGIVDQNPWERGGQTYMAYNLPPVNINVGGLQSGFYTDLYYEASLNYSNSFGKHNVTGLALLNRQQKNSDLDFPYYNEALVGRGTYDYARKYFLEVNLGYTGSERFAPGNRFGFFPSGAVGWTISEEPFFKNAFPWMNKMKLRYSEGLVGSDYASSRWLYISEFYTQRLSSVDYIREDKGANISAQWEEARKRDIGVEVGLFGNQLTLVVDLFDEKRSKMLLTPQTVTFLVGNSFKDLNLGQLKKHGLEIEAEFAKTTAYNLRYFVKGIFGFNENRVLYKDDLPYAPDYQKAAGKPLGMPHNRTDSQAAGVLTTGTGYFTCVDDIHNNPVPIAMTLLDLGDYVYLDYNSDAQITNQDKFPVEGCDYPPVTYSFSSGISYKGFDFNFLWQGNIGKWVIYTMNFECEFPRGNHSVHSSQLDYWRPDNQGATHATLHYFYGAGGLPQYTWAGGAAHEGYDLRLPGNWWRNADYLRLKDVYASYTFSPEFLKRVTGLSNVKIFATANNLLTFTKLIEGDPERKDFQRGFYPLMITTRLGVKFSF